MAQQKRVELARGDIFSISGAEVSSKLEFMPDTCNSMERIGKVSDLLLRQLA